MDDPERARVLDLLRRFGRNATSFQILEDGFRYAFDAQSEACVAYLETGRAWVVAGAPITSDADMRAVTERFLARARDAKKRTCFFAVEERFLRATGMPSLRVGEQPTWEPARWDETVRGARSLREQLRRARAKGVTVRAVPADEARDRSRSVRSSVEQLVARWLASRGMAPMGFLVDVQPFSFAEERRYFVAERGESLVAFLACVPVYARRGWLFEDLIRDPRAPNGTAELLVDFAMRAVAAEGATYATLGLAPLAGDISSGLARIRGWTRALYDFDGVRAFKAKLRPHAWEPVDLAYPDSEGPNLALYDVLAAFARGSFARFGLETLLSGPAIVVRALAVLLVPWTALLALAPARWFPSPLTQRAWVGFDAIVALGLFALATRWREPLARTLAALVTLDAAVTWSEVLSFNASRVATFTDGIVVALACAAPSVASIILWGGIGHRARMRDGEPRPL